MKQKYLKIIIILFAISFNIQANEIQKFQKQNSWAIFANNFGRDLYIGNIPLILTLPSDFHQNPNERYGNGNVIGFSYNFFDYQTTGIRFFQNRNGYALNFYKVNGFLINPTNASYIYARPDFEFFHKLYPFKNSFFIAPIFGSASSKSVEHSKNSILLNDFIDTYSFTINTPSRLYSGIDIGFTWLFFDTLFLNFGFMAKYAQNRNLSSKASYELYDYVLNNTNFNINTFVVTSIIADSANNNLALTKRGSSSLYFEFGISL
ncbi:hypothetical protein AB3N62_10760 [Leptospira sp. WS4.C2]